MRYLVVVEKTRDGFGAHLPDLPGCVAVGETREETVALIREAVEMHVDAMRQDGLLIPAPHTTSAYVEVTPPQ